MSTTAAPRTIDGSASGRSAESTILGTLAPHASTASTVARGTSASDCSTMRAMKGAVASTSGGMMPARPDPVPMICRVSGMMNTMSTMNGNERRTLTTQPSAALSTGRGRSEPGAVR